MKPLMKHWLFGILGVAIVATTTSGCASGHRLSAAELGIERSSYAAQTDHGAFDVSYLRAGDDADQRVIYVHGTPGSAMAFARYIMKPIRGLNAFSIDRPGFGETTPSRAEPSFDVQAQAVEPLLVERDGKWPILVGHSLGGPIVARIAATYPDRVGGVVILSGALDPALEKVNPLQYVGDLPLVCLLLPASLRHANHELIWDNGSRKKLAKALDRVTAPVTIVHGEKDSLVPVANVKFMRKKLAHAASLDVIVFPDENHFIPWTQEPVIRNVIRKLAGLPESTSAGDAAPQAHSDDAAQGAVEQ